MSPASAQGPGADRATSTPPAPPLPAWARDLLRCPVTGAKLADATGPDGESELHSLDEERPLAYPVHDGIPVLLASEAREL